MIPRLLKMLSVAVFLGGVSYAAAPNYAQAEGTCVRWDESDAMRCFDCMQIVSTPYGMRRINTCAPRVFRPGWYGWWRG